MTVTMPVGIHKAIDGTNLAQDIASTILPLPQTLSLVGTRSYRPPADPGGRSLSNAWQSAIERGDKMRALIAQLNAAWLQRMPRQEITRQCKAVGNVMT